MQKHIKVFKQYYKLGIDEIFSCQYCNQSPAVDIHHIIGRGMGKSADELNNISNLCGLCRNCHMRAEKRIQPYIEREELQSIVDEIINIRE